MHKSFVVSFFAVLAFVAVSSAHLMAAPVTMSWSPVGNPGNAADPLTGHGAVSNSYNIGTYDVTNAQYVAFLNVNDPNGTNALELYESNMGSAPYGGINFNSAAPTGSMYSVIPGDGEHPVNFVRFYNALRFANWMDNGQVPGATETGAYTLLGDSPIPSNANSITCNAGATIFLPSQDEWYKAAYYNPATQSYFLYPTSSDTQPVPAAPTATPNSVNYDDVPGNLTDVGAYSGTTSPFGSFDMAGDVWQWNDTMIDGLRGFRGGGFLGGPNDLASSSPGVLYNFFPNDEGGDVGFRLASLPSVPEPSTGLLAVFAFGVAIWWRMRFN